VISRASGWTTFTFGAGGADAGRPVHEAKASATASTAETGTFERSPHESIACDPGKGVISSSVPLRSLPEHQNAAALNFERSSLEWTCLRVAQTCCNNAPANARLELDLGSKC
jgi:hypothetical protein